MPDQTGRGDAINASMDAKIGFAFNVKGVQGNKDGGCLEECDRIKGDFLTVFELQLVGETDIHRTDGWLNTVCARDPLDRQSSQPVLNRG